MELDVVGLDEGGVVAFVGECKWSRHPIGVDALKTPGAKVAALASIVNRSVKDITLDAPIFSLIKLPLEIYEPDNCPLCKQAVPLVKPGSRKQK